MIWWPQEIPTLTLGLVTLRPSVEADIDAIFAACQDSLIPAFTTVPSKFTIDHAIDFVRSDPFNFAERREIRFVIEFGNGQDRNFAGVISLHTISIKNHTAEIGYWMTKAMRGKGIATLAAKITTDLGLVTIGFRRIDALVHVENLSSQQLLKSAGFTQEGILRNKVTHEDGRQIDMALYAASSTSWVPLNL